MPQRSDGAVPVVDHRRPPFCYQTVTAVEAIRTHFSGPRLATALGIYLTFTEVANGVGGASAREGFTAARGELASLCGVSLDTLDRYAREFVQLGLLSIETKKAGKVNLPNVWALTEPHQEGFAAPPGRTGAATPGRTGAAPRAGSLPSKKERQEGEANASPADEPKTIPTPPLHKVEDRNLGWDALCEVCSIPPSDPNASGEVAAALNGSARSGIKAGIRTLAWEELVLRRFDGDRGSAHEIVAREPWRFELFLEKIIRERAEKYRAAMPNAMLTPTALAKWWLRVEPLARDRGGMTAAEMAAYGG